MPAPDPSLPLACSMQRASNGADWHIQCAWKAGRTGVFTDREATALALLIIETLYPGATIVLTPQPQRKLEI